MPTDNPKISAYVPQAVYNRFKQFEKEQGLSMSQAVIVILAEYFGLEETIKESTKGTTVGGVTLARVEALEKNYEELFKKLEKLEKDDQTQDVKKKETEEENLKAFNNVTSTDSLPLILLSEPQTEIKPISGNKLSERRFGLAKDTVSGKKSKFSTEEFTKWTKEHDPDGIGWKYVELPSKGYLPDGDLTSEQEGRLLEWIKENIR